MAKDRSIRKKDATGRSVFAGSLPDPTHMNPTNPDNLHLTTSADTSHTATSADSTERYEDMKRIFNTLTVLNPAQEAPAALASTDSHGWYPDHADATVVAELRSMDARLIVLDTETTGFRPEDGAQITEICWYSLNSGDGGTFLPPHTLDGANEEALKISRYQERLAGKPQDDGTQVRALHAFLGGDGTRAFLVGSNPGFDAHHLNALFAQYGLPASPWNHRLIDPCAAAYWQDPDSNIGTPTGLKEASALSDVTIDGHHAAKADVAATAEVWHYLETRRRAMPRMR